MTGTWIVIVAVLIALAGLALVIGRLVTLRSTLARGAAEWPDVDTGDLGLSTTGPTILHFSAPWCGPCAGVRRVVDEVCEALPAVAHVEIDMDADPAAAAKLSVLSLPTTFIFDSEGRQRYRTSGVPTAADLRSALKPLLA